MKKIFFILFYLKLGFLVSGATLPYVLVSSNSPTIHSPTFQGTVTIAGTNALVLGGEARTNWPTGGTWDGSAIASGTITNITTESVSLNGYTLTNWPASPSRRAIDHATDMVTGDAIAATYAITPPWFGTALASGTAALVATDMNGDASAMRFTSSSSANSGYIYSARRDSIVLTNGAWTEFYVRPVATNNTVIFERIGFIDSNASANAGTDGLFWERNGMDVSLTARSNSVSTASATTFQVASNAVYFGRIDVYQNGSLLNASMRIWDSSQTLQTTLTVTNGIPDTYARATGHGWQAYSTNNVAVALSDLGYMRFFIPVSR